MGPLQRGYKSRGSAAALGPEASCHSGTAIRYESCRKSCIRRQERLHHRSSRVLQHRNRGPLQLCRTVSRHDEEEPDS